MAETFEQVEEKSFGKNGHDVTGQVSDVEKKPGIYDLRQFTPKI